jgi:HAD-hyrolase-like
MVGDSAAHDVVSGNRAGALTALLDSEGTYSRPPGDASLTGERAPTLLVSSLAELQQALEARFTFLPPSSAADGHESGSNDAGIATTAGGG